MDDKNNHSQGDELFDSFAVETHRSRHRIRTKESVERRGSAGTEASERSRSSRIEKRNRSAWPDLNQEVRPTAPVRTFAASDASEAPRRRQMTTAERITAAEAQRAAVRRRAESSRREETPAPSLQPAPRRRRQEAAAATGRVARRRTEEVRRSNGVGIAAEGGRPEGVRSEGVRRVRRTDGAGVEADRVARRAETAASNDIRVRRRSSEIEERRSVRRGAEAQERVIPRRTGEVQQPVVRRVRPAADSGLSESGRRKLSRADRDARRRRAEDAALRAQQEQLRRAEELRAQKLREKEQREQELRERELREKEQRERERQERIARKRAEREKLRQEKLERERLAEEQRLAAEERGRQIAEHEAVIEEKRSREADEEAERLKKLEEISRKAEEIRSARDEAVRKDMVPYLNVEDEEDAQSAVQNAVAVDARTVADETVVVLTPELGTEKPAQAPEDANLFEIVDEDMESSPEGAGAALAAAKARAVKPGEVTSTEEGASRAAGLTAEDAEAGAGATEAAEADEDDANNDDAAEMIGGTDAEPTAPQKRGNVKKKLAIGAAAAAALVCAGYGAGVYYYNNHFLPNTGVDGVEIGGLTVGGAALKLTDAVHDPSLSLSGRGGAEENLDIEHARASRSYSGIGEALEAQNAWCWPMAYRDSRTLELPYAIIYDEELLKESIGRLAILDPANVTEPQNAYVAESANGGYMVVPEEEGNLVDSVKLLGAVKQALLNGKRYLDLEEAAVYEEPEIRADDPILNRDQSIMSALSSAGAAVDLGGGEKLALNGETLYGFLNDAYAVDSEKVRDYVLELAQTYNTYDPEHPRTIVNHAGEEKSLTTEYGWELEQEETFNGLFGLIERVVVDKLGVDPAVFAEEAAKAAGMMADAAATADAADGAGSSAENAEAENAEAETVEAESGEDTAADHMVVTDGEASAEDEAEAAEGENAEGAGEAGTEGAEAENAEGSGSGDAALAADSENGNAALAEAGAADSPYTLQATWIHEAASHGENDFGNTYAEVDMGRQTVFLYKDGECILESPCVTGRMTKGRMTPEGLYVINSMTMNKVLTGFRADGSVEYRSPVKYWMPFNKGIGFHDASWRGTFGGEIYKNSGSHGCVNLPRASAETLYKNVYKGMPVVIYY